jgi:two-component system response regulator ArlR
VIDDEPKLVNMVSRALSRLDLQVDRAYDGLTGLTMALSGRYELVLLDLALPGLNGVTVLRRVIEARPEQQVVVCSGRTDPAQKAHCLELGAAGYLTKPFDLSKLVARLCALRADRPSRSTLHSTTERST